ncbi:MAG: histidine kinase N-terminal 7TM domain-containing protein [Longimicrobiales bacterium]
MNASLLAHVTPLVLGAALSLGLVAVAWSQRAGPRVRWFLAFSTGLAVWSLAYAGELTAPGLGGKILASKIQYLGISSVPVAWFLFAAAYAGVTVPAWGVGAAFAIPAATLVLAWTNELHGLIWAGTVLEPGPGFSILSLSYGPWFWVHVGYSYLVLVASAALLARMTVARPPLFRRQALLLLGGCITPWLGNALYLTGLSPNSLDLTVFGFGASAALGGWAVLRWRLLSVGPVARDTLVEGMREGVVVVDPDGTVVDVNRAASEILERDERRIVGQAAPDVLGRFLPGGLDENRRQVHSVEDGRGRTWECRLDPLRDRRRRFRGWTLVLYDVTRQATEAAALERARKVAEDTAEAQRAFMTNMNHELRTPLNGVLGMLQVLDRSDLDPVNRHYVAMARSSGETLLRLVDRLLDFTQIDAGRIELASERLDPNDVARAVTDAHRDAAGAKGLAVHFTPAPGLPDGLLGDARRLAQVVDGLVENAVKFTDAGHVHVRLTGRDPGTDGAAVPIRFEVFDTGIGIPAHRVSEVFRSFVQADGSSTRRHEGAGIGLASTRKLVEHMGGRLNVESEEGRGSRFWFEVPLRQAVAEEVS